MASIIRNNKFNASVEIIYIQRRKIFECMTTIYYKITDLRHECYPINNLIDQLKQLCNIHFIYEDQLLGELDYQSADEDRLLHEKFMSSIDHIKIEKNQCHMATIIYEFINLRLEFITYLLNETKLFCDFIKNYFGDDSTIITN